MKKKPLLFIIIIDSHNKREEKKHWIEIESKAWSGGDEKEMKIIHIRLFILFNYDRW